MTKNDKTVALMNANGIHNAQACLEASQQGNRPTLPRCIAMLLNETSGGLNIYGHEGPCPELYGQPVTEANYQTYKAARNRGEGVNGVGPTQITDASLQVEAEKLGGCWVPLHNMSVGFGFLHQLIEQHGVWGGFEHYNGSGPAAEAYANRAVGHALTWESLLKVHGLS